METAIRDLYKLLSKAELLLGKKNKVPLAEQDWIYLTHHMHQPEKEEDMEILHHCYLYSKKGLKGEEYSQKHVKDKKVFQHVLDIKNTDEVPAVVYDHLNNVFKIKVMEINKKSYAVINGLKNISKTKWSDQDRG